MRQSKIKKQMKPKRRPFKLWWEQFNCDHEWVSKEKRDETKPPKPKPRIIREGHMGYMAFAKCIHCGLSKAVDIDLINKE